MKLIHIPKDLRPYPKHAEKCFKRKFAFVPTFVDEHWVWFEHYYAIYAFDGSWIEASYKFEHRRNTAKLPTKIKQRSAYREYSQVPIEMFVVLLVVTIALILSR